ncbi:MAG: aminotransferase class V-fold PLP-dependent enzyme [Phycisphaerales bacterium]
MLDTAAIRAHFPGLAGDTVVLDNAGGSQVPGVVIEAIATYFRESYVQLNAGYPRSIRATQTVRDAHAWINRLMNGSRVGETILGPSSTQLCHMLAGCHAKVLRPGDEIVIAECGHEANIGPWLALADRGVRLRWWHVDDDPFGCPLASLEPLLNSRTHLVCFPHVSNLLGGIVDVERVTRLAHEHGAKVVVDGVAFAPHRAIDVEAWGCDWYVWSTYKVYGPHMGALFGRAEALAELTGPNHFFIPRESIPYKFEVGGASHEGCAGLVALEPYLAALIGQPVPARPADLPDGGAAPPLLDRAGIEAAFEHMTLLELPLQRRLIDGLASIRGVRLLGPTSHGAERVATVSFVHPRVPSRSIAAFANKRNIGFRSGHMYAYRLCEALGIDPLDGVVRISAAHYNTIEEIDLAVQAVRDAVG